MILATGKEPLKYQWQWKPAGEGEQLKWQDLCCDGTTFQEVESGLKLTGVQACHTGDYRCVVSNSAGIQFSQCASLTVGKNNKPAKLPYFHDQMAWVLFTSSHVLICLYILLMGGQ